MRRLKGRLPHRIEELFFYDPSVLPGEQAHFFHSKALSHVLGRDVILESHDKAVAMRERSFSYALMDFVVIYPPLILAFDLRDPPLDLFHTRNGDGFDALNIRRIQP